MGGCGVLQEPALDELVDDRRAHAFDVHRNPPGEMLDPPTELLAAAVALAAPDHLRRAPRVLATPPALPRGPHQRAAARRPFRRHLPVLRVSGAVGIDDPNDLRD